MNLKVLLTSLALCTSLSAFAISPQHQAELDAAGEDLIASLVEEYGNGGDKDVPVKTDPPASAQQSLNFKVNLKPMTPNSLNSLNVQSHHHEGDGIFDVKFDPTIFASTGSTQLGTFNLGGGLENSYFSADVGVGFGAVRNENTINGKGDGSDMMNVSAAVRAKLFSFLEVGIRGMTLSPGSNVSKSYTTNINGFGYDVRINLFKQKDHGVNGFVSFSGMQKNTLAPNFIQAGIMLNLRHIGTNN
jgi:hypothetical protein